MLIENKYYLNEICNKKVIKYSLKLILYIERKMIIKFDLFEILITCVRFNALNIYIKMLMQRNVRMSKPVF
jgi:hypothetical protein